jgi:hypothetical protein
MTRRTRKLIGTLAMLVFVMFYALLVMALAQPILRGASTWTQLAFYAVAGLAWVAPIMPLIAWMERGKDG